jgi:serine/threonine-protein kinase
MTVDNHEEGDGDVELTPAPVTESVAAGGERLLKKLAPFALVLLLLSATVWSVWIFGQAVYRDYLEVPQEVSVPNVTGLEIREAFQKIEEAGLRLQAHESRYDKEVKKRIVLTQEPAGGKMVRAGRTILVVVSLGPELIPVPNVTGESLRTANIAIGNAKLRVGKITFEDAVYGQDEEVLKQNPSAGKEVPRGQQVHLTVRRGSN